MQCSNHPDREAVAMCISCRNFFCSDCRTVLDGKNYCFPCTVKNQPATPSPTQSVPISAPASSQSQPETASTVTPPLATAKKKSGCLKWAIISILIAFFLAVVLTITGIIVYKKIIAPKIKQKFEQPFAEVQQPPSESTTENIPEQAELTVEDTTGSSEAEKPDTGTEAPVPVSEEPTPLPPPPDAPNVPPPGVRFPQKPVSAVHFSTLLPYLPNSIPPWQAGKPEGQTLQFGKLSYTSAEREYTNPLEKNRIKILIFDYAFIPHFYAMFVRPMQYSNSKGYLRAIPISHFPAIEKMDYEVHEAELFIEVGRRYVIQIQGENITDATVLTMFANQIELTKLSQLR